ncbi:MAG: nucleoside diphosphate kinase regulator [Prolixibacteraceae bacterium]|nr:nucleoside diphosphate kinase regulator [Prolixibacteraceae bacterium]
MKNIIVNRLDYIRIQKQIGEAMQNKTIAASEAEKLINELNSATILDPDKIPGDVVTMNSVVKITFVDAGKQQEFKIVYPNEANLKEKRVSIFSPVATALIGFRVGDLIEWMVPGGLTKIRIDEIIYQPEAAGDLTI